MTIRTLSIISALCLAACTPRDQPDRADASPDSTVAPAPAPAGERTASPRDTVRGTAAPPRVVGAPVQLGGQPLPAGTYTLYSLPTRNGWTLIVNGQTGQWGTEYAERRDVMRVPMSVSRIEPVDTFRITVEGGDAEGHLVLAWDTLQGTVPVRAR